jgi:hypothetical protein
VQARGTRSERERAWQLGLRQLDAGPEAQRRRGEPHLIEYGYQLGYGANEPHAPINGPNYYQLSRLCPDAT